MWDVLLSLCLLDDPSVCRLERRPGGADYAACRIEAARLSAPPAGWQAQDWPCVRVGEDPAFSVTEIAPGVWVHKGLHAEPDRANRGDLANLGFVIGEQAVAVIDSGSSPEIGGALLAAIRARTELPVRWLILTHMHPDHALGARVFRDAGARVIGHERLGAALSARAETYRSAMVRLIGATGEVVTPDESVADMRDIDLGGRVLTLQAHPLAHTDNDLSVLDHATGTWFLGDLLFMGHAPALDGSILGWLRVTEDLGARTVARVVPGHGPVAAPWPDSAEPMRDYLKRIVRDTRAEIASGAPMLAATGRIGAAARGQWLLFDAFNERTATAAFKELEWE